MGEKKKVKVVLASVGTRIRDLLAKSYHPQEKKDGD